MTKSQRDALNRLARPIMRYLKSRISASGKNMEIRLEFSGNGDDLRVVGAGINAQGGRMMRQSETNMIAHWHFPDGELIPSSADHRSVKCSGLFTAVITHLERRDRNRERMCCEIWEVGMPEKGKFMYRSIKGDNVGSWIRHGEWK